MSEIVKSQTTGTRAIIEDANSDFWSFFIELDTEAHFSAYAHTIEDAREIANSMILDWDTNVYAILEQCNGCVFDPENEHTHRGFVVMGLSYEQAKAWVKSHEYDLEYVNGAGGISAESHYIITKRTKNGWISA